MKPFCMIILSLAMGAAGASGILLVDYGQQGGALRNGSLESVDDPATDSQTFAQVPHWYNSSLEQVNLARDYGPFRAVRIKAVVTVEAEESLVIDFVPTKEQAVLNGIELNRKL